MERRQPPRKPGNFGLTLTDPTSSVYELIRDWNSDVLSKTVTKCPEQMGLIRAYVGANEEASSVTMCPWLSARARGQPVAGRAEHSGS